MDLITDLPLSDSFDSIFLIVDQGCLKATRFIPCLKTIDGTESTCLYMKHILPFFGLPRRIISDRDPQFTSQFSRAMCKNLGIQQNLSSAFHPRTDGQTERMNAWVEQYLQPWTSSLPWTWATMLPITEFTHNSWKHNVTRKTPHELLTGIHPQVKVELIEENVPAALDQLTELEEARKLAQEQLEACQKIQDTKKGRQWAEMEEGDQVWLEAKNFKVKGTKKLMPRRYGPFKIMKKISPVAYQLNLPQLMKIHDVFHADLLSPYKETEAYGTPYMRPPPDIKEGEEEYEVKAILDMRHFSRWKKLQYLVHWVGYPHADDMWVNHEDLHAPELLKNFMATPAPAGRPKV
jgi:Chromo (CHRromatin Organisation MOdifier) domain